MADKTLRGGPVHVSQGQFYVIMAEDQFRELSDHYHKSYPLRVPRSLNDVKVGRVRLMTAQALIGELGLDA
jgi:hypothetical protein